MSGEQNQTHNEFWNIVETGHFYEDILVPVLADNALVRHTLKCKPFLESRADEEDCESELEKLFTHYYGLPAELSAGVFELCEENLKLNEECEVWIESDGEA